MPTNPFRSEAMELSLLGFCSKAEDKHLIDHQTNHQYLESSIIL